MPRIRRRTVGIAAAVLLLLLVASAAIYARIRGAGGEGEDGADPSGGNVATSADGTFATGVAIPVSGVPAVRSDLVLSVSASGQADAWRKAVVVAQVSGRVASLPVRESERVAAGSPLVALDAAEYGLAVEEAEANLQDAREKYREMVLFDDRIDDPAVRTERERIARARSGLDAAEVRLRRARLDLSRTTSHAPFAGRVASLEVDPGQWVQTGEEMMTIVDLDPIKVEVQVLESEVAHVEPGRGAAVRFSAFPDEVFTGRVQTVNPMVESGTRTARVTVLVPNPGGRVLPGMYARVSLEAERLPDRVLVPRGAILERDRRTMLFVYEGDERGGLAKWRYVTPGMQNDSLVEVLPGDDGSVVEPGEVVLTDGHYTLTHDARVRLVDDVEAEGGRPQ